jgi:DNA-binding NarL/FixJ family response regulator
VLIVKVDVAGVDPEGAQRACDVRLVRTTREQVVDQRRDSGADGEVTAVVILRDATPSHVASCVRAATGGGPISSEALRQIRLLEGEETAQATATKLSEREYEVLRMLADGESTRGIAERLSYSERTVKNIVHDLLAKLNCKTRAHAVALAARQGVI